MLTIQTRDSDGSVVQFPVCAPKPKPGYTVREVDAIPAGPGKLQWDQATNALVRFVAPLTARQTFDAAVAAGYAVPGITPPFVLPMDDAARNLFHQLSYQLMTMESAGRIAGTDQFPVTDITGAARAFSAANIQTMIMGLGEAYLALWAALHAGS